MMALKGRWVAGFALGVVAVWSVALMAKPVRFITIDYPGAVKTTAYGINPAGDIVGSYVDAANREHGFVLRDGSFSSFDWPGSTWTRGWGINPSGDIVGQYGWLANGSNTVHGFLLKSGEFFAIDVPNQPNTMPVKINPGGTVVGCYHVASNSAGAINLNTMFGFVWDAGGISASSTARTMHNGVNPDGDVVGLLYAANGRVEQSYLIHDGVTTFFQFLGSLATQAWDINPSGTIVGFHRTSLSGPNQFHGFVLQDGAMTSLDVEGATDTRAYGISANGDIVGVFVNTTGTHGFLLSRRGPN
jgi:uncharacterized membrane protein